MAETSTLQRASNLYPEEGLVSLSKRKENMEYVDQPNRTPYVFLDGQRSQTILHADWPCNVLLSHHTTDEPSLPMSKTAEHIGTSSGPWRHIPDWWSSTEHTLMEGSNYFLVWGHSYAPSLRGSGLSWEFAPRIGESTSAELDEVLADLNGAIEEAEELGFQTPSPIALSNARRLSRKLYRITPRRFEVYPTPDAEIAIDAPGDGSSLVILCGSDGGVLCMANLPDGHITKAYSTIDTLPDSFVSEALARLVSDRN